MVAAHISLAKNHVKRVIIFILVTVLFTITLHPIVNAQSTIQPQLTPSKTILRIKVSSAATIDATGMTFSGSTGDKVVAAIGKTKLKKTSRLFGSDTAKLKAAYNRYQAQGEGVSDLSNYYTIELNQSTDTASLSKKLKTIPGVLEAYPQPAPTPLPSPNLVATQTYRKPAGIGMGVDASPVTSWPGAKGTNVKIVDLEYAWNMAHEDLTKVRATASVVNTGTAIDPFNDSNHGTAVLGTIAADVNSFGISGIAPNVSIATTATNTAENNWNVALSIYTALDGMKAGDVMLIEHQAAIQEGVATYVPIEWIPEVYDAVKYATAAGIIVVEPGGNSGQNLDTVSLFGSSFPGGKTDSGAIIVGSAQACDPAKYGMRRSDSSYGKRINLYGIGECAGATGYGDAYNNGPNALYAYTYFGGTSAASAQVAAAAAIYSSAYQQLNGVAPSPAAVRSTLATTGTKQNTTSSGALQGNIGAMPNLPVALLKTDKTPPLKTTMNTIKLSKNKPVVSWKTASDNVKVAKYNLYRNGMLYKTITSGTTYTDTGTKAKTKYTYKVTATDLSGNVSTASASVSVTTK